MDGIFKMINAALLHILSNDTEIYNKNSKVNVSLWETMQKNKEK